MSVLSRNLRSRPSGGLAVVASLMIGIAGLTSVYSILRSTPILSRLIDGRWAWVMTEDAAINVRTLPSKSDYIALAARTSSFDRLVPFATMEGAIRTDNGARPVTVGISTREYFELAGPLVAGRIFDETELENGRDVAMIAEPLARSLQGAARAAVGTTVMVDGYPLVVVGVFPLDYGKDLHPGQRIEIMRAIELEDSQPVHLAVRLRYGIDFDTARAELATWTRTRRREVEGAPDSSWILLRPLELFGTSTLRMIHIAVFAALLLTLVTGSNVLHLLAAQTADERHDAAIRFALGARRVSLLRWKLGQVGVVGVVSGVGAFFLAKMGISATTALVPESLDLLQTVHVGLGELTFSVVASVAFVGLGLTTPLLSRSSEKLANDLRTSQRLERGSSRLSRWIGYVHVTTTSAVAVALIVASYQVLLETVNLRDVDVGFSPTNVEEIEVSLPESEYQEEARRRLFFEEAAARIAAHPGIDSVALASWGPYGGGLFLGEVRFAGDEDVSFGIGAASVGPGYFHVLGQRLIAGRAYSDADLLDPASSVVISETASRRFGSDPMGAVGKDIWFEEDQRRVVGVVGDTSNPGTPEAFGAMKVYWPIARYGRSMTILAKGRTLPDRSVREIIAALDEDAVVTRKALTQVIDEALAGVRFLTTLVSLLALLAMGLALFGVYGVLTHAVARSRRQLALRLVLGGGRRELRRWTIAKGGLPIVVGVGIGLAASYPLCDFFASQLTSVQANDPSGRMFAVAMMLLMSLAAIWPSFAKLTTIRPAEALKGA